ncbi:MAG: serine/threonine-protein kinase [Nannocystaceae bacterium]|nr:serine/threonine-protein kinase [Nannocystaceae bacterium]
MASEPEAARPQPEHGTPPSRASNEDLEQTQLEGGSAAGTLAEPAPGPSPGTVIGRYFVVGEIGRGGMGRVLRAYDPKLRREIAIKLLRTRASATDRARMLREARAMAQLSHPNVVAVYDVDEAAIAGGTSRAYVAMELVGGRDLKQWLAEGPRGWVEVVAAMLQVGDALAAAHAAGLVHRDVKPANVLVGDDGRVRIGDFGLARTDADVVASGRSRESADAIAMDPSWDAELTLADTVMGTPAYMAPEQHCGATADARCDQFAFAATTWTALLGVVPYAGDDAETLLARKLAGPPAPPEGHRVPRWLIAVLQRGLAPQAANRWVDMRALLTAMREDPTRRRRRWLGAAALVTIAALGVGAWQLDRAARRRRCGEAAAAIESLWGEAARAQLAADVTALHSAAATAASERLIGWLDRYAARWHDVREAACIASELDHAASPQRHARASECLEERREYVVALVERLAAPDTKQLHRATTAAAALPSLEPCADAAALARRPAWPSEPREREAIAATVRELAAAVSLRTLGRYDDALAAAERAHAQAVAVQWAPLQARASLVWGQTLERVGEFDRASEELEHAVFVAAKAGDDELAAEATTALAVIDGVRRQRPEDGLRWVQWTEVALARMGAHEDLRVAALQANLGAIERARGHYDAALVALDRALAIVTRELGDDHPEVATVLVSRAETHRDRGALAEADADAAAAIAIREAALGPDHPLVASLLSRHAEVLSARGHHPQALAEIERAREIWNAELGASHWQSVALETTKAQIELAAGLPAQAVASYDAAIAIAQRLDPSDPDLAALWRGRSVAALAQGAVAEAVAAAELAITHCRGKPGREQERAAAELALARAWIAAGDRERARQAAAAAREHAPPGSPESSEAATLLAAP